MGLWMQIVGDGPPEADPAFCDASTVARALGIPLSPVDFRAPFQAEIIAYFLQGYLAGQTPNPCALCNPRIKFGLLMERALALGAKLFATGHYARVEQEPEQGRFVLLRGIDTKKDQSYFLWGLSQGQLACCCFPNGESTKAEVRRMARSRGLPISERGESQDICFIPSGDCRSFLERVLKDGRVAEGAIVDKSGRILGRHGGVFGFTIGQRQGIGVPAKRPYYVLRIDPAANQVVVGPKEELLARGLTAHGMHWVSIPPPRKGLRAIGQIRYRHAGAPCEVTPCSEAEVVVCFDEPQEAITPGQALVLYQDDRVLGGGWIGAVCHG
ncbi:MAG: tRNA 2-thiouridine(34) synthase MnmA [Desulfobacterales bacterium]|nr:tRNA 2-thiouridine(34) synthase MnmA [Desulfobacterales bacterium]